MNRTKKTALFILLIILTAAVVFVPMAINAYGNSKRLTDKDYWQYNSPESKITSRQVADLYHNDEISAGMHFEYGESQRERIIENISAMTDEVFADNIDVKNKIENMILDAKDIYFSRESLLITSDGFPVALNFFNTIIYTGSETVDILYEEKTKTLIYFSCILYNEGEAEPLLKDFEFPESFANSYYNSLSIPQSYIFYEEYNEGFSFGISVKITEEETDIQY